MMSYTVLTQNHSRKAQATGIEGISATILKRMAVKNHISPTFPPPPLVIIPYNLNEQGGQIPLHQFAKEDTIPLHQSLQTVKKPDRDFTQADIIPFIKLYKWAKPLGENANADIIAFLKGGYLDFLHLTELKKKSISLKFT